MRSTKYRTILQIIPCDQKDVLAAYSDYETESEIYRKVMCLALVKEHDGTQNVVPLVLYDKEIEFADEMYGYKGLYTSRDYPAGKTIARGTSSNIQV